MDECVGYPVDIPNTSISLSHLLLLLSTLSTNVDECVDDPVDQGVDPQLLSVYISQHLYTPLPPALVIVYILDYVDEYVDDPVDKGVDPSSPCSYSRLPYITIQPPLPS